MGDSMKLLEVAHIQFMLRIIPIQLNIANLFMFAKCVSVGRERNDAGEVSEATSRSGGNPILGIRKKREPLTYLFEDSFHLDDGLLSGNVSSIVASPRFNRRWTPPRCYAVIVVHIKRFATMPDFVLCSDSRGTWLAKATPMFSTLSSVLNHRMTPPSPHQHRRICARVRVVQPHPQSRFKLIDSI